MFEEPIWVVLGLPAGAALLWLTLRKASSRPGYGHLVLRAGLLLACIGALAGISVPLPTRAVDRVYLLDLSNSFERNEALAREAIEEGARTLGDGDRVSVVTFAERAATAIPPVSPRDLLPLPTLSPPGSTKVTHIEAGLLHALRAGGGDPPTEIFLLTDGRETLGRALLAAAEARSLGVPIFPMDLGIAELPDIRLDRIRCPTAVRTEESFLLEVVVSANRGGRATLRLKRGGREDRERVVLLRPGIPLRIEFEDRIDERGLHRYEADLLGLPAEANRANNRASASIRVGEVIEVIALSRSSARVSPLGRLPGVRVQVSPPDGPDPLARSDLILIDNLGRSDLGDALIREIESAVREGGAGLVVLGGRRSFGPGGYAGSGLEALLPVSSDPEESRSPGMSLAIVLDASGSMAELVKGETKFQRAVRSILPIPSLGGSDRLEVITFREEPDVVVPLHDVASQAEVRETLLQTSPGGGTRLFPALARAVRDLAGEEDRIRHVVVLSDGRSEESPGEWKGWEDLCRSHPEVTTSVIAVGGSVDEARLEGIARVGGGRYRRLEGITEAIAEIYREEVRIARGSLIREEEVEVVVEVSHGPIAGLGRPPPLFGFVATAPKDGATVYLRAGRYPILAGWRAGVGRVLAFPSALDTTWGRSWRAWSELPVFLSQAIRWAARPSDMGGLDARLSHGAGGISLEVEARDDSGPREGLQLSAAVEGKEPIPLRQVGSGLYRAILSPPPGGNSPLLLLEEREGGRVVLGALQLESDRRREMYDLGPHRSLLGRIADVTGGRYGEGRAAADPERRSRRRPLRSPLLWLALALFLMDLALPALRLTGKVARPIFGERRVSG